ncbi:AI-2E family transporter [Bizionia arctica]|uniref:AI-2E family transporter n=1 Tax=Bizionia arctica TaxID=1495645 RepID=A0A917GVF7_9FLAO|nr:AI-2E family transporter [Bizionia arctica]GGG58250.1 AI-2E family transporter [Bizionia arctica]
MINAKKLRQIFLLLLIVLIVVLIFREMMPYFSGVLGAITFYFLLRGTMSKLVRRGWNPNLAAGTLLFLSFISILIPIAGAVLMLGNKIGKAANNSEAVTKAIKVQLRTLESRLGFDLTSQIDATGISSWLSDSLTGFAGGTFNTVIAIAIMYFLLFYMLTNRKQLKESLMEYIPLSRENLKLLGKESGQMVRANAFGIPLVAVAQGIVALIGFFIFGVESPFFWAVIVAIGSMVPFIGTFLGVIPVFILTISNGDSFQAWGILLYGFIVVGSTDNIIRLFILQKLDNVHPLITLIGVIIGIPLFGFIGLIFGPLLISLFLIFVRIYKKEYASKDLSSL